MYELEKLRITSADAPLYLLKKDFPDLQVSFFQTEVAKLSRAQVLAFLYEVQYGLQNPKRTKYLSVQERFDAALMQYLPQASNIAEKVRELRLNYVEIEPEADAATATAAAVTAAATGVGAAAAAASSSSAEHSGFVKQYRELALEQTKVFYECFVEPLIERHLGFVYALVKAQHPSLNDEVNKDLVSAILNFYFSYNRLDVSLQWRQEHCYDCSETHMLSRMLLNPSSMSSMVAERVNQAVAMWNKQAKEQAKATGGKQQKLSVRDWAMLYIQQLMSCGVGFHEMLSVFRNLMGTSSVPKNIGEIYECIYDLIANPTNRKQLFDHECLPISQLAPDALGLFAQMEMFLQHDINGKLKALYVYTINACLEDKSGEYPLWISVRELDVDERDLYAEKQGAFDFYDRMEVIEADGFALEPSEGIALAYEGKSADELKAIDPKVNELFKWFFEMYFLDICENPGVNDLENTLPYKLFARHYSEILKRNGVDLSELEPKSGSKKSKFTAKEAESLELYRVHPHFIKLYEDFTQEALEVLSLYQFPKLKLFNSRHALANVRGMITKAFPEVRCVYDHMVEQRHIAEHLMFYGKVMSLPAGAVAAAATAAKPVPAATTAKKGRGKAKAAQDSAKLSPQELAQEEIRTKGISGSSWIHLAPVTSSIRSLQFDDFFRPYADRLNNGNNTDTTVLEDTFKEVGKIYSHINTTTKKLFELCLDSLHEDLQLHKDEIQRFPNFKTFLFECKQIAFQRRLFLIELLNCSLADAATLEQAYAFIYNTKQKYGIYHACRGLMEPTEAYFKGEVFTFALNEAPVFEADSDNVGEFFIGQAYGNYAGLTTVDDEAEAKTETETETKAESDSDSDSDSESVSVSTTAAVSADEAEPVALADDAANDEADAADEYADALDDVIDDDDEEDYDTEYDVSLFEDDDDDEDDKNDADEDDLVAIDDDEELVVSEDEAADETKTEADAEPEAEDEAEDAAEAEAAAKTQAAPVSEPEPVATKVATPEPMSTTERLGNKAKKLLSRISSRNSSRR